MRRAFLALGILALLLLQQVPSPAADPEATVVFLEDLHCASCAQRLANRLYAIPGVVSVKTSLQKKLALIAPQSSKPLSPKQVWEAVEAAELTPIKITGPGGTFTEKPAK